MRIKTDHAITRTRLFFANTATDITITQITIIAPSTRVKVKTNLRNRSRRFLYGGALRKHVHPLQRRKLYFNRKRVPVTEDHSTRLTTIFSTSGHERGFVIKL